jgi:galactokinase/mevalonate kinase-like predicted kinase
MISVSCYTPSWNRKENFASIRQFSIDESYAQARNQGAIGGKITGASGDSYLFLLFI